MKPCYCKIILGALVIVFAWWTVDWANIALTVIGAVIVVMALLGRCCCKSKECCSKDKEEKSE